MKKKKTLLLVAVLLLISVIAAAWIGDARNKNREAPTEAPTYEARQSITVNGESHRLDPELETILFLGIDNEGEMEDTGYYFNEGQSDFMMVALINDKEETYTLLHINRDTMAEYTILGLNSQPAGTDYGQITLAHTYGSGTEDSCRNSAEAVSNLLCGVNIDRYFSMTMDGVAVLNDSVGGVTLECLDDFEDIPEFKKGATVTLTGEEALTYVRGRIHAGDQTNLSRMARQRQYIGKFLEKFMVSAENEDFALSTFESLAKYVVSDMTVYELAELAERLSGYTCTGIESIQGEAKVGAEGMVEFYPEEAALQEQVIRLFCVE